MRANTNTHMHTTLLASMTVHTHLSHTVCTFEISTQTDSHTFGIQIEKQTPKYKHFIRLVLRWKKGEFSSISANRSIKTYTIFENN